MNRNRCTVFFPAFFLASFLSFNIQAQQYNLPLQRDVYNWYEPSLNNLTINFHSSVRPYRAKELQEINTDSVSRTFYSNPDKTKWLARKVRTENLIRVDTGDFYLTIDPLLNFEYGRDMSGDSTAFVSTRGFIVNGNIGNQFSFSTAFRENQGTFPSYLGSYIRGHHIVPGQGKVKPFYSGFDYAMATGYVSYTPSKYFNFQAGSDKHFFGDGYRSLLLSDNAFSYPFLKITTTIWKIKYVNLFTQMRHIRNPINYQAGEYSRTKFATFHYLSYNVTRRLNISLFESVVWQDRDTLGKRGFDWNYLNPIIFYRPVEFSLGSTDNALVGLNLKYRFSSNSFFYGQLLLDEFKLNEVKSGRGWSNNKQAFQTGFKFFNLLGVKNLGAQTEFNFVRPYTYTHIDAAGIGNYAHYDQPLAHPLGANFIESVSFLSYRYKSIYAELRFSYAQYGADSPGKNFGSDIFKPYVNSMGNYIGQGIKTDLVYTSFRVSYIINPKNNLNAEAGVSDRTLTTSSGQQHTPFFYVGIRTSLMNFYYDF